MKKKDLILILIMILAAVAVLFIGLSGRNKKQTVPDTERAPDEIAEAIDHDSTIEEMSGYSEYSGAVKAEAASYFEKNPAESYLLVRTNQSSSPPIPLNEEYSFTVKQHDGSENVIHVGVNSFYMESSNCDNQNCVDEGTVTLDNMNERVLFNMILCLPHQLSLEMLTPDEAKTVLLDLLAQQETLQQAVSGSEAQTAGNSQTGLSEESAEASQS